MIRDIRTMNLCAWLTAVAVCGWTNEVSAYACDRDPYTAYDTEGEANDPLKVYSDLYFATHVGVPGSSSKYDTIGLYYWNVFGFANSSWDRAGWGFDDYDNGLLPLGRALGAFEALRTSFSPAATSWSDRSGPVVKWAYPYSAESYNDMHWLRASCGPNDAYAMTTRSDWEARSTTLYSSFTYELNPVTRASVLFHEALHYVRNVGHSCGTGADNYFYMLKTVNKPCIPTTCTPGSGRDEKICVTNPYCTCARGDNCTEPKSEWEMSNRTIYGWQIEWLVSYARDANINTTTSFKGWAKTLASSVAYSNICNFTNVPETIRFGTY